MAFLSLTDATLIVAVFFASALLLAFVMNWFNLGVFSIIPVVLVPFVLTGLCFTGLQHWHYSKAIEIEGLITNVYLGDDKDWHAEIEVGEDTYSINLDDHILGKREVSAYTAAMIKEGDTVIGRIIRVSNSSDEVYGYLRISD